MRNQTILILFFGVLLLAGCKTIKQVKKTRIDELKQQTATAYVEKLLEKENHSSCITAHLDVNLIAGNKNISSKGLLRMKKDEVIQLSFTIPFLGAEVGRIEFTPQKVLMIDRINKQYAEVGYGDVGFLAKAHLDFYALQSLFRAHLFLPENASVSDHSDRFHSYVSGNHTLLSVTDAPVLNYYFLSSNQNGQLAQTKIQPKDNATQDQMLWEYGSYEPFQQGYFPHSVSMKVKAFSKKFELDLSLYRLDNDADWNTHTSIPRSYRKRNIGKDFFGLLSMF